MNNAKHLLDEGMLAVGAMMHGDDLRTYIYDPDDPEGRLFTPYGNAFGFLRTNDAPEGERGGLPMCGIAKGGELTEPPRMCLKAELRDDDDGEWYALDITRMLSEVCRNGVTEVYFVGDDDDVPFDYLEDLEDDDA